MIQTLPCPGCHRTLALTADVSLQAVLRCRHCSHQFVLGEMVEAELGFWEVVDDPNAPAPKVRGNVDDDVDDAELELAKSDEYISPQLLLKKQAEKKHLDSSQSEPITQQQYERMRRKGKSPIWSMLSVLLGGLASIPIATLLIWHVLGKDPLRMGPVVGRYAPWIVPARFQPYEADFEADNGRTAPPAGASGFRRFDNVMNASPSDSSKTTAASASDSASTATNAPSETNTTTQSRPFIVRDRRAPRPMQALPDFPETDQPTDETNSTGPSAIENPVTDVFTIINQVEKDLDAWNERGEDRELHKKLALQTYSNLATLALTIDQIPLGSPLRRLVRTELHGIGLTITQHTDLQQQLIQAGSRFWLTSHQDEHFGLAVVIEIAEVSEVDNVWQITALTAANEEAMLITVPKELISAISPGQKFFILGSLTRIKPAADLEAPDSTSKSALSLTASYIHALAP